MDQANDWLIMTGSYKLCTFVFKSIDEWFCLFQMENLDSSLTELKSNFEEKSKNLEEHNNTVLRKVKQAFIIVFSLFLPGFSVEEYDDPQWD